MADIPQNGGAFFTGSVHVGAINGVAVYQALLSQASTGAPTATVLYNNLGTIVWSRTSAGIYVGTLVAAFTSSKTGILISNGTTVATAVLTASRTSDDAIGIKSWQTTGTPALADDLISGAMIQILIMA